MTIREVAKAIGCAPGSVARWEGLYVAHGKQGLDPIPNRGGIARLSFDDKDSLTQMLVEGPNAHGYRDGVWTLRRVRELIARRLGVDYSISQVHRLMHQLGFSAQKPQVRALERDESAIASFRRHDWAKVKKRPRKRAKPSP